MADKYQEILRTYWGYPDFRGIQRDIIESIARGEDTLGLMPTGGGKSITFQVPALAQKGVCIVVTPLIALMKDQVQHLKARNILAEAIYTGLSRQEILRILENCIFGEIKFLYVSPERLSSELFQTKLRHIPVSFITVDEAHCISQWGYDFRPSYLRIADIRQMKPGTPVLALTATATPAVVDDIQDKLQFAEKNVFKMSFERKNLAYIVRTVADKQNEMTHILQVGEGSAIGYARSRNRTKEMAEVLSKSGIPATFYHAGLDPVVKDERQKMWQDDEVRVMVATNAFGMGIDKSNVRWVIHYNMPKSIESFYQEIGRAGRDGAPSDTVLFYSMADIITLRSFCEESGQRDVNMEKLRRMEEYAESRVCRRRILLNYFGETSSCNCGNCDVCKNPPRTFDGTIRAQKALSAVVRSGEHIAVGTCIEILRGMHSSAVVKNKYNEMKTFGVGRDTTSKDWNAYLLQMLQMGFFEIAYNNHNYMKVTDLGWKVLKGEHHVSLAYIEEDDKATRPKKTVRNRKGAIAQPGNLIPEVHAERVIFQEDSKGVEDKGLFEHLRKIRKNLADEQGYPPYIVLSDKSLHELARMKPTTKNAMSLISGIGEFKLNKYGDTFIKAIRKYTGL